MRYYFGKAAFALFLGLLCFNNHKWFTILIGVILFVVCVLYLILGFIFIKDERQTRNELNSSAVKKDISVEKPQSTANPVEVI